MKQTKSRGKARIKVITDPEKLTWLKAEIKSAKEITEELAREDRPTDGLRCRSRRRHFN